MNRPEIVEIMLEESAAIAEASRLTRRRELSPSDCIYWLERAAENMRRYAGWLETERTPGPAAARLLAAAKDATREHERWGWAREGSMSELSAAIADLEAGAGQGGSNVET